MFNPRMSEQIARWRKALQRGDENNKNINANPDQLKRLFTYLRPYKGRMVFGMIAMFIGTAVHEKIERDAVRAELSAFRISPDYHEASGKYEFDDFTLVGTMDVVNKDRKLIQDYKCLGSWKTRSLLNKAASGEDDEYFHQLNVYRAAFYPEAETLRLHIFVKDFSANSQRMYKLDRQEYRVNVPIYDAEKELDAVRANIEESRKDEPRSCTREESWGGMRCKKFCPNRLCMCYEGPEYDPREAT